jgi:HEAT repeat protein
VTAVRAVASLLAKSPNWALRVRAARALGSIGTRAGVEAIEALQRAAQKDDYALVRQSACESLAKIAPSQARAVLQKVAAEDPEPRVRENAKKLLRR